MQYLDPCVHPVRPQLGPKLFLVCKHSPIIPSCLWVPVSVWVCVTLSVWTLRLCHNLSLQPQKALSLKLRLCHNCSTLILSLDFDILSNFGRDPETV